MSHHVGLISWWRGILAWSSVSDILRTKLIERLLIKWWKRTASSWHQRHEKKAEINWHYCYKWMNKFETQKTLKLWILHLFIVGVILKSYNFSIRKSKYVANTNTLPAQCSKNTFFLYYMFLFFWKSSCGSDFWHMLNEMQREQGNFWIV